MKRTNWHLNFEYRIRGLLYGLQARAGKLTDEAADIYTAVQEINKEFTQYQSNMKLMASAERKRKLKAAKRRKLKHP